MIESKDLQAMLPLLKVMFKDLIKEAVTEAIVSDLVPLITKAAELHDHPTVKECMRFLNVKSRTTWDKKAKEYKLRVYRNKITSCKTYEKKQIVEMYILEKRLFVN